MPDSRRSNAPNRKGRVGLAGAVARATPASPPRGADRTAPAAASRPGIHGLYLRLLLDLLQRHGLEFEALPAAARSAASELRRDDTMVDVETLRALVPALMRVSGRPWLGLELGAAVPVFGHGPLALAAAASGSLQQALELIARFLALRAPVLTLQLRPTAAGLRLVIGETEPLGEARQFVFEAVAVMLERLLQALSGRSLTEARWELPWPAPDWARHYPAFLAAGPRFGAKSAALLLPQALADSACLGADPDALAFARAECERRLAEGAPGRELMAGLRRRLLACEGGYPSAAAIAASLGLSLRSFHRQLAAERVSYRRLLEQARRERALHLLRDTELSVEAIAERLGYADASNFSRCAKRWFGMSARELRGSRAARRPTPM